MKAIFYDRKNKREVSSEQLMSIRSVEYPLFYGDNNIPTFKTSVIGAIGYKSNVCPNHCDWDLYLMESDLIFLRME